MAKEPEVPEVLKTSLLIGLGGTGQKVLLEAKRSLLAASRKTPRRIPDNIRFLVFDTDEQESTVDPYTGESIDFGADEFLRFRPGGSRNVAQKAVPGEGNSEGWWPEDCSNWPSSGPGAAAKRLHGRAKLANQIETVKGMVERAINRCRAAYKDIKAGTEVAVRVTIVGSLAGGTGAGCWLDIANLVHRRIRSDLNDDRVWGVFLLGDAFEGTPGTQNRSANTCGALRELQWLMEGDIGKEHQYKNYVLNGLELKFPDGPIFNSCFLVTKKTKRGNVIEDPLELMKAMGRYLFHMCGEGGDQFARIEHNIGEDPPIYGAEGESKRTGNFWSFGLSELVLESERDKALEIAEGSAALLGQLVLSGSAGDSILERVAKILNDNKMQERGEDYVIDYFFNPKSRDKLIDANIRVPHVDTITTKDQAVKAIKPWNAWCRATAPSHISNKSHPKYLDAVKKMMRVVAKEVMKVAVGSGGSLSKARALLETWSAEAERQREMMAGEVNGHEAKVETHKRAFIRRANELKPQTGIFGWKKAVHADFSSLEGPAKAWAFNEMEIKRKERAVDFFEEMKKETQRWMGDFESSLNAGVQGAIQLANNEVDILRRGEDSNFFRQEVKIKGEKASKFNALKGSAKFLEGLGVKGLSSWLGVSSNSEGIYAVVKEFVTSQMPPTGGGINNWITKMPQDNPAKFSNALKLAQPLWTYDPGIVTDKKTQEFCVTITKWKGNKIPKELKDVIEKQAFARSGWAPLAEANYLTVIRWEFGAPAYGIESVQDMMEDYEDEDLWEQSKVGFQLHGKWKDTLPSIKPDREEGERKQVWAVGVALGLINERGAGGWIVQSTTKGTAQASGKYLFRLKVRTRQGATAEFVQDRDLCEEIDDQTRKLIEMNAQDVKKRLEEAKQKLSDSVEDRMEGPLKRTLSEELENLLAYLGRSVFQQ